MSHPALAARPSHGTRRPTPGAVRSLGRAAVGVLAVTLLSSAVVGPAYAAHGVDPHQHHQPGQQPSAGSGHGKPGVFHLQPVRPSSGPRDHDEDGTGVHLKPGSDQGSDQGDTGAQQTSSQPSLSTSVDPGRDALAMNKLGATPAPITPYELPFPCGQTWTGSTRANHTPSPRAIDWNAPNDLGSPVVAAATGTVTTAVVGQHLASYGQYVVIDHGNGESTLYGHLDSVIVTVGQAVTAGQQIGTLGSTGNSTGPHLHFEERLNGVDQDVWLHGAVYPIGAAVVSTNCGTATTTTTTTSTTTTVATRQVPLAANMIGSAAAEVLTYRKRAHSYFELDRTGKPSRKMLLGDAGDQPVLGDWDGDGKANIGVRRPSARTFYLKARGHEQRIRFGQAKDLPIAGNWDGVGGWEIGVRKASSGVFKLRAADGSVTKVTLGDADDIPVTGDWNGDGRTDLGVYDPATSVFTLEWTDAAGTTSQKQVTFGQPGDFPVAGDWDGDGVTDVGVWDPLTKTFERDGAPTTVAARTAG